MTIQELGQQPGMSPHAAVRYAELFADWDQTVEFPVERLRTLWPSMEKAKRQDWPAASFIRATWEGEASLDPIEFRAWEANWARGTIWVFNNDPIMAKYLQAVGYGELTPPGYIADWTDPTQPAPAPMWNRDPVTGELVMVSQAEIAELAAIAEAEGAARVAAMHAQFFGAPAAPAVTYLAPAPEPITGRVTGAAGCVNCPDVGAGFSMPTSSPLQLAPPALVFSEPSSSSSVTSASPIAAPPAGVRLFGRLVPWWMLAVGAALVLLLLRRA